MNCVSKLDWPDEAATRPRANVTGPFLAFASRVDRLAGLALERLLASPDDEALNATVASNPWSSEHSRRVSYERRPQQHRDHRRRRGRVHEETRSRRLTSPPSRC